MNVDKTTVSITSDDFKGALSRIGIAKGDLIMVHSSLSALGYVQGGPSSIVDTLMDVITRNGTILMPAYPFQGSMLEHFSSKPVFQVSEDKSYMGAITEYFRTKADVRSFHPSHSIAVWGKDADWFVKDHHLDDSPFGKKSPFYKVYKRKGKVLCVGSDIGQVTVYHIVEDMVDFPKQVYLEQIFKAQVFTPDGLEITVVSKAHDPKASIYRIDNDRNTRELLENIFLKNGMLLQADLGKGKLSILDVKQMVDFLVAGSKSGVTIYGDLNKSNETKSINK